MFVSTVRERNQPTRPLAARLELKSRGSLYLWRHN